MNLRYFPMCSAVSVLVAVGAMLLPTAAAALPSNAEDVQILTRGPVHEAFAEVVNFDPQPGLIVRAQAPKPIEELPPEQQLEGDNVTWIPGYWAWDDERNDFLWISGIWRNLPPGRQWIPGYWSDIGEGQNQWTSGYWADATSTEVSYIPTPPPRNIDIGPNIASSSDDQSWIPGNWVWVGNRYLWRPGYWMPLRTDWTWVPSRYSWSRRGYVYVDGYWDYAVANRGVLFAPVYFNHDIYGSPDYYYTPSIVIGLNVFSDHLFMRPLWGHYYFGDYYASRYRDCGYYGSYSWDTGYRSYDPICSYERWQHRDDRTWEGRRRADFDFFRDHEDVRPRHTWTDMQEAGRNRYDDGRNRMFANSLDNIARSPVEGQRFRSLDRTRREQIVSQGREVRNFSQTRHQMESRGTEAGAGSSRTAARENLARSPVVGLQPERLASSEAPPQRPEARGTNIRVNPATKARMQAGTAGIDATRSSAGRQSSATGWIGDTSARTSPSRTAASSSTASANRNGGGSNVLRLVPGRQADAGKAPTQQIAPRQLPSAKADNRQQQQRQVTQQRQVQPQSSIRQAPQRQIQAAPQRQMQAAPQRQVQPQAPIRQAPQRQMQAAPQRQVQPGSLSPAADPRGRMRGGSGH